MRDLTNIEIICSVSRAFERDAHMTVTAATQALKEACRYLGGSMSLAIVCHDAGSGNGSASLTCLAVRGRQIAPNSQALS